ncbi:hypothetical protein DNTS_035565 [Danionella cerebrum]|uniref:C2H2-type domain-containing protein n=1 Tax=Danionella cerebrum TaxID=2873325 RepID=A0A553QMM0_9TELE|nr:hypothetical protein DNTS_035565 [Danionella translucida]
MGGFKDEYQDVQPVTLQLSEENVTSSLYCHSAQGIETRLSTLVEAFLVEVYRCRVCQFTSNQKTRISHHVIERHDPVSPCPKLPCLEKENEEGLGKGMAVDDEVEVEYSSSPYNLEIDLHSGLKNHEDPIDMERISFLLPIYSIFPNISPRSCAIGLGSSSDGNLHVAQTCEVSTLFEEDRHDDICEEESVFHLDEASTDLTAPLNDGLNAEVQDEEMAQSAHLMTLGLCRISSSKCQRQSTTSAKSIPEQEADTGDNIMDAEMHKPSEEDGALACFLCQTIASSRSMLEVHLKCHSVEQGFRCPRCHWESEDWVNMEQHLRAHGKGKATKRHKCKTWKESVSHIQTRHEKNEKHQENARRRKKRKKNGTVSNQGKNKAGQSETSLPRTVSRRKEFCCNLCDKKFSSKLTMRRHMGIHQEEKPFKCPHCHYCTRLKASLIQHLRIHTGEKPYKCPQCSYASIDRSSLRRHSRTHTQEKPHCCQYCPYSSAHYPQAEKAEKNLKPVQPVFILLVNRFDKGISSHLFVNDCWVAGLERFAVGRAGEEEFFEIRTEWSDKSITHTRRRYQDIVKLLKNLTKSFPEDRGCFSQSLNLEGLQRIKEAKGNSDETRLDEVENFLRNLIKKEQKVSQSEAVLSFFKTSPLDYTLKTLFQPGQTLHQSPVTVADVRRANGFCLANTETVILDPYLLSKSASLKYSSEIDPQMWTGIRIENGSKCVKETVQKQNNLMNQIDSLGKDNLPKKPQCTSNITYLQLQGCETDILE